MSLIKETKKINLNLFPCQYKNGFGKKVCSIKKYFATPKINCCKNIISKKKQSRTLKNNFLFLSFKAEILIFSLRSFLT